MDELTRAAAEILRSGRSISADFRERVATMVEAKASLLPALKLAEHYVISPESYSEDEIRFLRGEISAAIAKAAGR